jgi:hypothetical protein
MTEEILLSETQSICPECFTVLPARRVAVAERVHLRKTCPEHGPFEAVIWRGNPAWSSWARPKTPSYPKNPSTSVKKGCPLDCGLCADHRQDTCTALIEVTQRCNLRCRFCFADAGNNPGADPALEDLKKQFDRLFASAGPCNVQLSGGEPTLRDDLPEIVILGRSEGFPFIQIDTNGLRLSEDPSYVKALKAAGLASVFLQFDGMDDNVYRKLRGRELLREKRLAIEHCAENGMGVVLVPTLVPGVNTDQIGAIIEFALQELPAVRGVHFQPVSYFGRYPSPPGDEDRITIPEVITEIETQTGGRLGARHFKPPGCENALCSFHGNFVLQPDGELSPWTRCQSDECCCKPVEAAEGAAKSRRFVTQFWSRPKEEQSSSVKGSAPSLGAWDDFLIRARTHSLCVSGMAFQDAWTLDLDRLRDCCIHTVHPDGRLIPFCAYNATDINGRSYYREAPAERAA